MNQKSFQHPYKTFDEQLDILKKRELIIDDPAFAVEALKSLSYYTLVNGYKDLFLLKDLPDEKYREGTTFSMLYQIHWLDLTMSNLLFKYTLVIEKKLKIQIADYVARNWTIDEEVYLKQTNYSQSSFMKGKYRDVIKAIDDARRKDDSCKHYMDNEGNLPPWIAAKGISFGSAVNWYTILRPHSKLAIIQQFFGNLSPLKQDEIINFFKRVINQVYQFRNLSAHGNRTFLFKLPEDSRLSYNHLKKLKLNCFFENRGQDNLFSVIMSMLFLINDPYIAKNLVRDINDFFREYDDENIVFLDKTIYDLFDIKKENLSTFSEYFDYKFSDYLVK
ncbi:TPA: Abi family protein [Enterococcus faecium]|nr:Abi family protein [Enterococcus faecium]HAR1441592.1 Abi family protein [Enterococcus faecium]HAR1449189.1 Abi family protein [Enterococcus faecium]HAR1455373.1 Abi family protein [Enterococcus faecium]HAR1458079.1 Abi family protein [Enterococcus faecium]